MNKILVFDWLITCDNLHCWLSYDKQLIGLLLATYQVIRLQNQ